METFSNIDLLEPLALYKNRLKDAFHANSEELFEKMAKEGNVDIEGNKLACNNYYKEVNELNNLEKTLHKKKVARGFALFFGVLLCVVLIGIPLLMLAKKIKKEIEDVNKVIEEHTKKRDEALAEAYRTIAGLNDQFEWNMAASLMSKTIPLIQLDQVFDPKKFSFLNEKYDYEEYQDNDSSAIFVQSGSILGNPFVFKKTNNQSMRDHVYTGSLTITYKKREYNGKSWETRTVTETLHASLKKPEPYYFTNTTLIYGNEAAPNLSFSRTSQGCHNMSDKEVEKVSHKFNKELDKMTAKSITKGGTFQRLANEKFEALFRALDRDHETEFRLLFTPLAQQNMISILRDNSIGYGDDFSFIKRKKLNYVNAAHMNGNNILDTDPSVLKCFDYSKSKETFVNYCDSYLKNIYFNFAPLLAIPLYQQHKTAEYIYHNQFKHNVTQAEVECAANSHNIKLFMDPRTRSEGVILKSNFNHKVGKTDYCTISAHSFEGIDQLTYVPTLGGDGHFHDVPVHWVEYRPIVKQTPFAASDLDADLKGYNALRETGKLDEIINQFGNTEDVIYKKRILSFIAKE